MFCKNYLFLFKKIKFNVKIKIVARLKLNETFFL